MIAQNSVCVSTAVARGIMLHGMAAQLLARAKDKSRSKLRSCSTIYPKSYAFETMASTLNHRKALLVLNGLKHVGPIMLRRLLDT